MRAFSNGELVNPSRGRYYLLFVKTRYLKAIPVRHSFPFRIEAGATKILIDAFLSDNLSQGGDR